MTQAFAGIRVVDATHVLAGPFATYQLALLGADVIKVEHPSEPDQARTMGVDLQLNRAEMGTLYLTQSSNKRSISLDLKSEAGREAMVRLVDTADVLVENYRPGAFEALGLGYEALRRRNPRLIYCSMSAFGQTGPKSDRTGYDHVVQATSGIMFSTGTKEVSPLKMGPPVIDYATGTMGAFALASALFQRERTDLGQKIDLAMVDVSLMMMCSQVSGYLRTGKAPQAIGNRLQHATMCAYETRDGLLMLGAASLRQQRRFWNALERPDMVKSSNEERDADLARESALLSELMRTKTADEWESFLQARHVPAARVRNLSDALEDPQTRSRRLLHRHDQVPGIEGAFTVPLAAFDYAHGGPQIHSAPPVQGQHTAEVLRELGYSKEQIEEMKSAGTV